MTTITLEVPDELAEKLTPLYNQLPELLSIAVELYETSSPISIQSELVYPALKEVIDFLLSQPTPEQIIAFKVSPFVQARLEELLDKNREDELIVNEVAELDAYEQVNHLLVLLKARARLILSSNN